MGPLLIKPVGMMLFYTGADIKAHRLAYVIAGQPNGPLTSDKPLVCHKCDWPLCCEPLHLFPRSWADNSRDSVEKGRQKIRIAPDGKRYFRKCGHEVPTANSLPQSSRNGIRCRSCHYKRSIEYQRRVSNSACV
jgi:hypothetical protein